MAYLGFCLYQNLFIFNVLVVNFLSAMLETEKNSYIIFVVQYKIAISLFLILNYDFLLVDHVMRFVEFRIWI